LQRRLLHHLIGKVTAAMSLAVRLAPIAEIPATTIATHTAATKTIAALGVAITIDATTTAGVPIAVSKMKSAVAMAVTIATITIKGMTAAANNQKTWFAACDQNYGQILAVLVQTKGGRLYWAASPSIMLLGWRT
jgi:hypothetical protein